MDSYEIVDCGIHWKNSEGSFLYETPLILKAEELPYPQNLLDRTETSSPYLVVIVQAGRAALGVAEGDQLLVHRNIQKYMVRKSQGKSQLSYLAQKGKSRLGSRIRLQKSREFFAELSTLLNDWQKRFEPKLIFLSCGPNLKGAWYQSANPPPFQKKDSRLRRIPFHLNNPSFEQLKDTVVKLSSAKVVAENGP